MYPLVRELAAQDAPIRVPVAAVVPGAQDRSTAVLPVADRSR